ncbi:MAG: phosphatidylglycerophosphate synthase [Clostridiales bacterium]|nr:phosphatidylglycerophosphate synthase [Clostridiales bacterium]
MDKGKQSNLNLPNALTMLRLLLIPVFIWLMAADRMMSALVVFVFASLTDILDGWIARKWNLVTDFGKLFDPLADKLMVLSVMAMHAIKGIAPLAAILILFVKEALMLVGGLLLLKKQIVVYSQALGKMAQFVTVIALVLCFFHEDFNRLGHPIHLWALWTGVGLALASFVYYANVNGRLIFSSDAKTRQGG